MGNWDAAPWMTGGGVKHSTFVARLLAYAAFGGNEGIVGPRDLQVRERAVPGNTVRVAPGACAILNRNPAAQYDAYAARLPVEDYVAISPTGSGSGRTDLVVARIKNPFMAGEPYAQPTPEDIAAGVFEFVDSYVISNMAGPAPGTHPTRDQVRTAIGSMSALPLASIAIPASTATIAQSYIKDWREMSAIMEETTMRVVNPAAQVTLNNATIRDIASVSIDIPPWATHWSGRAIVSGAKFNNPQSVGNLRMALGGVTSLNTPFDESTTTSSDRAALFAGASLLSIPAGLRGTQVTAKVQGSKSGNQDMVIPAASLVSMDFVFHARPESN